MEKIECCGICLEYLNNNIENLQCNHTFHTVCITKLKKSNCKSKYKCPICRNPFKNINKDQDQYQDQDQDQPSSQRSSPNPEFSFPIIQALMFSRPFLNSNRFA